LIVQSEGAGVYGSIHRDKKKLSGVFVRFRAPYL
jgi:hypothetical protein